MVKELMKRVERLTDYGKNEIELYSMICIATNGIFADVVGLLYDGEDEETSVYLIINDGDGTAVPLEFLDEREEIATIIMHEIEQEKYYIVDYVQ